MVYRAFWYYHIPQIIRHLYHCILLPSCYLLLSLTFNNPKHMVISEEINRFHNKGGHCTYKSSKPYSDHQLNIIWPFCCSEPTQNVVIPTTGTSETKAKLLTGFFFIRTHQYGTLSTICCCHMPLGAPYRKRTCTCTLWQSH